MKKLLLKNKNSNTVVKVLMYSEKKQNKEYECVGVITKEDEVSIRIAFTAKKNVVVDYIDVKKTNIISIKVIKTKDIIKI